MTTGGGMTRYEIDQLAGYNSRVAQGIVHTPEYAARMRRQQARFNEWQESGSTLIIRRSGWRDRLRLLLGRR
jgi:FtsZ-binding cell division protein ZapB